MKQKLNELKGDFNIPLSITGKTIRYKISKDTEELKNTVNLLDLIGIYRKFYPTTEYTFSSSTYRTLSMIDHNLSIM